MRTKSVTLQFGPQVNVFGSRGASSVEDQWVQDQTNNPDHPVAYKVALGCGICESRGYKSRTCGQAHK